MLILQALKFLAQETDTSDAYYRQADQLYERYPTLSGMRWRMRAVELASFPREDKVYLASYARQWRQDHPPQRELTDPLLDPKQKP